MLLGFVLLVLAEVLVEDELFFTLTMRVRAWRWLGYLFIGMGIGLFVLFVVTGAKKDSLLPTGGVGGMSIALGVLFWFAARWTSGKIELRRSGMFIDVLRRRGESIPWADVKAVSVGSVGLTVAFHEHATLQLLAATEGARNLDSMARVIAHNAGVDLVDFM